MEMLLLTYVISLVIVAGLFAWTYTKPGKKWLKDL